jgi:hypothetical protein
MADHSATEKRHWNNFWSTITKDGTRYRHQVQAKQVQDYKGKYQAGRPVRLEWMVRTEVWPDGDIRPHYTVSIPIPTSHGRYIFDVLRAAWSNVDEKGRDMYPPEYKNGFVNLGERNAE